MVLCILGDLLVKHPIGGTGFACILASPRCDWKFRNDRNESRKKTKILAGELEFGVI
jgi:hypothetical protein